MWQHREFALLAARGARGGADSSETLARTEQASERLFFVCGGLPGGWGIFDVNLRRSGAN